jgi:hypothetical protein
MTESRTTTAVFPIIAEGYDPVEVNRYIAELQRATKTAQQHALDVHAKMSAQPEGGGPAELNFDTLGSHIANLVKAAHEAATSIRRDAEADARATSAAAERAILLRRADAESEIQRLSEVGEDELEKARTSAAAIRAEAARVLADADERAASSEATARKKVAEISAHRDEIIGHLVALHKRLPDVIGATAAMDAEPAEAQSAESESAESQSGESQSAQSENEPAE